MLWLLAPFIHTPPHDPPPGRWEVTYVRAEAMTPAGTFCAWEAESLVYDGKAIWASDPPEDESFCKAPFEAARTVDVLGEDGPFLSVRFSDWGCCPEREQVTRCVTYDLRTGAPTTLEAYDPKRYAWRSKKLARVLEKKHGGGWSVEPGAFVVGGGHVKVCATRDGETLEVPIR